MHRGSHKVRSALIPRLAHNMEFTHMAVWYGTSKGSFTSRHPGNVTASCERALRVVTPRLGGLCLNMLRREQRQCWLLWFEGCGRN